MAQEMFLRRNDQILIDPDLIIKRKEEVLKDLKKWEQVHQKIEFDLSDDEFFDMNGSIGDLD